MRQDKSVMDDGTFDGATDKKEKIEIHHCIPLSLSGMDIHENTIRLEKHVHAQVHAILNIPHKRIRDLRSMQSDLDVPFKEVIRKEGDLIRAYFANIRHLPPELIDAHVSSLIGQIQRLRWEIKKRTIV